MPAGDPNTKRDGTQVSDPVQRLAHKLWTTSGSRFNAARRLRRRSVASLYLIAYYSVIAIIIGTLQIAEVPELASQRLWLGYGAIWLSIIVLAVSVLESGRNHAQRAENLERCARRIKSLEVRLEYDSHLPGLSRAEAARPIALEYERILDEFAENHETDDYRLLKSQHPADFQLSSVQAMWIRTRYYMVHFVFYALLVAWPLVVGALVVRAAAR